MGPILPGQGARLASPLRTEVPPKGGHSVRGRGRGGQPAASPLSLPGGRALPLILSPKISSTPKSTHAKCCTCSRNADHDARPATCLSRLNGLVRSEASTSNRPSSWVQSGDGIRATIRSKRAVFTSPRIRDVMSFNVENPGSSNEAFTTISNATLIRSAGLFFTTTAARITATTTTRARSGSSPPPTRSRISFTLRFGRPLRSHLRGRRLVQLQTTRRT